MFSVMVCPSLKPKSSFGPESPTWPLLLISSSFFTHLQNEGDTQSHRHANKWDISAVNQNSTAHVKDSSFLFYIHHLTSLHFTAYLKWSCRATLKSNASPLSPKPTPMKALRPADMITVTAKNKSQVEVLCKKKSVLIKKGWMKNNGKRLKPAEPKILHVSEIVDPIHFRGFQFASCSILPCISRTGAVQYQQSSSSSHFLYNRITLRAKFGEFDTYALNEHRVHRRGTEALTHRHRLVSARRNIGWSHWPFPRWCRGTLWPAPGRTALLRVHMGQWEGVSAKNNKRKKLVSQSEPRMSFQQLLH